MSGRVYTTTVNPDNTIDGTVTIYGPPFTINTAALSGTITPAGAMSLKWFNDDGSIISFTVRRIAQTSTPLSGRAWCFISRDNVTVRSCGEFDSLKDLTFIMYSLPPQHVITLHLGAEVAPDVYKATVDWLGCWHLNGLASFAVSEDGVFDELAITVVSQLTGTSTEHCNFRWWLLRATR